METPQIFTLINTVRESVGVIKKTKQPGSTVSYAFRSIDEVVTYLGNEMQKNRLVLKKTQIATPRLKFLPTKNSKGYDVLMTIAVVSIRVTIVAPDGSKTSVDESAQSNDNGDKAVSQAESLAFKHALCRLFMLAAFEDPDAHSTEIPSAKKSAPAKVVAPVSNAPKTQLKKFEGGEINPVWAAACTHVRAGNSPSTILVKYTVSTDLLEELNEIYKIGLEEKTEAK